MKLTILECGNAVAPLVNLLLDLSWQDAIQLISTTVVSVLGVKAMTKEKQP